MGGKQTIIVAQGHDYLFWTMGAYYTWELSQHFDVVLVVNEDYRNNQRFHHFCRSSNIHTIYYFPKHRIGSLSTHRTLNGMSRNIIARHKPAAVVQHDYIGVENMYLFHWSKTMAADCQNIVILTSNASTANTMNFLVQMRNHKSHALAEYYRIPAKLIYLTMNITKALTCLLDNYLIPSFLLKETPYLSLSLYSNIDNVPRKPLFDAFLVYHKDEMRYLVELFHTEQPFHRIQCPLETVGTECNERLYGLEEGKLIVLLPSLIGMRSFVEEKEMLTKWSTAITELRHNFPDYKFCLKFHPRYSTNTDLNRTKDYLIDRCPFLNILAEKEVAFEWILKSKIIVGDVSTTLWWAGFLSTKLVISFDIHNYPISGSMKGLPNLIYFDNISDIVNFDFNLALQKQQLGSTSVSEHLPTLIDFISKVTPLRLSA